MTSIDTSNEAVERLLDGVTPGPWRMNTVITSCGVCHKIGPWPHKWRHGIEMSACIYDDYPPSLEGTDNMQANAGFIAAARDLVPALLKERDALRTRIDELEAFITDFASAKFDSLPLLLGRHPADEPDPVTDATVVWSWQEDANELLKGEKK